MRVLLILDLELYCILLHCSILNYIQRVETEQSAGLDILAPSLSCCGL